MNTENAEQKIIDGSDSADISWVPDMCQSLC